MRAITISPPSEEASLESEAAVSVDAVSVDAVESVVADLEEQAARQPSSMTTASTRLTSFIAFFIFIYLTLFLLYAIQKKRLCKKQNRFECLIHPAAQAASGVSVSLLLFALLLLCIIIITRPHASTRRTSRPRRPRMQRQMDTRIIMKKDTARIAVSLQNAAESAVHAEAAQQVAGAQLDASEQAVFCFAVNCIIMRTSLK